MDMPSKIYDITKIMAMHAWYMINHDLIMIALDRSVKIRTGATV